MDQLITEDPAQIGPYRLIGRLGAGGMGLVYLGRSEAGRTVAVKVVQAEHAQHPEFRRRFTREVEAARRVGGEWTAAVLDADTQAPVPWVATQYIPGPDLTTVVARDFGPLPEHSVRVLAHRLAVALRSVHAAGLIHRDLKPSNVLVTVDGPRVIDFGIARAMDTLAGDSLHTRTGMLIGSPGFMSPEQVRGLELTPASDVFCLGAVLVYAATGRLLFGAAETGLNAHLFRVAEEEPDLTGVPESLAGLVRECLDKDPARRPTPVEVAARTESDGADEWLPGSVLAQLGRHAALLLDFAPEQRDTPVDPRIPAQHQPAASPTPPAYAPTTPVGGHPAPPGFGPPPGFAPGAWSPPAFPPDATGPSPRRWWGLAAAVPAQLLVVIGAALTSAAAPSIQQDLDIPAGSLNPLFLAYGLAFGGLLLLGGHLTDLLGRKRALLIGLAGFAAATALGGSAGTTGMLVGAQAVQGGFAALLSASALALVIGGFADPRERGRAFGLYAVTVGGGLMIGIFTSGWLIDLTGWRVCLYVLSALAGMVALVASRLEHDRSARTPVRLDAPGVLLGTGALAALVYGLDRAAGAMGSADGGGWTDPLAVALLVVGAVLSVSFAWWQTRTSAPLVPAYVIKDRQTLGSLLALALAGISTLVVFLIVHRYMLGALGSTQGEITKALLPLAGAVLLGSTQIAARLQHRLAPRHLIVPGLLLASAGTALLTRLDGDSSYTGGILPGLLLVGLGLGLACGPLLSTGTGATAARERSGATAAMVLTAHHLGGWAASPLMGGVFAWAITDRLDGVTGLPEPLAEAVKGGILLGGQGMPDSVAEAVRQTDAAVLGGYSVALWCAAGLLLLASLLAGLLITAPTPERVR
ncbi:bifunctional serine/threonine protein kinase/MFS transporter [Streptomyces sp. NBC_01255]|uniref:bifunctional serine/threonine protein kinase/MFS transporter n=1 Tax=Streptomyces sp. NBC_01255 TaxID=2903798 RepID=UPI002E341FF4|nr:bifunctional serine/threonine protein kinase/MFS transporter [Streptomyces sp. NBC_01255]